MADIDKLIAAATNEQRSRQRNIRSKNKKGFRRSLHGRFTLSGWVALAVLLAALGFVVVQIFMPVSKADIQADLETTLQAAHDTVEAYRRTNGHLPERVPAAALADLVHLERNDDGYRLRATSNGMTLERDY